MVGNVVGHVGKLPPVAKTITIRYTKIERQDLVDRPMKEGDAIITGIGTATLVGYIKKIKKDTAEIELNHPACIRPDTKIAVLKNIDKRWRLTGYGMLLKN